VFLPAIREKVSISRLSDDLGVAQPRQMSTDDFSCVFSLQTASQGPGVQNGESHFTAGDARAEEAASVFATNDPAGFTIVDLLMWGSIGHAIGYSALASQSFVELLK